MTGRKLISNMPHGGLVVAVDGPSGTGKSSMCRAVAQTLDAQYLDTGAMYRIATLAVLRASIDPTDVAGVVNATADLALEVNEDPTSTAVIFDGDDVSGIIRGPEVTAQVSAVSAIAQVRENLVRLQRDLTTRAHRVIVEGRDIGTVVLPDAPTKVFLTASAEIRARRRWQQETASGRTVPFDEVFADVVRRDELDSSREVSPLRPAADAVIIDTSEMTPEQVQQRLIDVVKEASHE